MKKPTRIETLEKRVSDMEGALRVQSQINEKLATALAGLLQRDQSEDKGKPPALILPERFLN